MIYKNCYFRGDRSSGKSTSFRALKYRFRIKKIKTNVILHNFSRMILILLILIFIEEFSRAKNFVLNHYRSA